MLNEEYAEWVNNEYNLWKLALLNCMSKEKFLNFKSEPQINRMIGVSNLDDRFINLVKDLDLPWDQIEFIDKIGNPITIEVNNYNISNICLRYVYYANKILNLINDNDSIIEIGGGYGGLCSIIDVISKHKNIKINKYAIYDLSEVQQFQKYYLDYIKLSNIKELQFLDSTNLQLDSKYNFCISCYALGEFDIKTKHNYINNIISKVEKGFILWNPHKESDNIGESLLLKYHPNLKSRAEEPLTSKFNLEIIL